VNVCEQFRDAWESAFMTPGIGVHHPTESALLFDRNRCSWWAKYATMSTWSAFTNARFASPFCDSLPERCLAFIFPLRLVRTTAQLAADRQTWHSNSELIVHRHRT
jgi:hypothetical protein